MVAREDRLVSIVIPFYNEVESIPPLIAKIHAAMEPTGMAYEVITVDDGSADGSFDALVAERQKNAAVRVIRLRRNYGQTPAMAAGFDHCRGDIVVTMDGDLQNDPADIPMLLAKLDEGYEFVCGWRRKRQDKWLSRKLPSKIANWLIGRITGVRVHDYGCSLKAYETRLVKGFHIYSDMHRFIPAMAKLAGARITEVVVNHHHRQFGVSKYGISRTVKVVLDLLAVKMIMSFSTRPAHWFGFLGIPILLMAFGALLLVVRLNANYMPISVLLFFLSFHFFSLGLLGELVVLSGDHHVKDLAIREEKTG